MKSQNYEIKHFIANDLPQVQSTERQVFEELLDRACVAMDNIRTTNKDFTEANIDIEIDSILRCISAH